MFLIHILALLLVIAPWLQAFEESRLSYSGFASESDKQHKRGTHNFLQKYNHLIQNINRIAVAQQEIA